MLPPRVLSKHKASSKLVAASLLAIFVGSATPTTAFAAGPDKLRIADEPANSPLLVPPGNVTPNSQPSDQPLINDIINGTVTSPSTQTVPALPQDIKDLPLPALPPDIVDHNKNKTINLGPLHTGPLIQIATLRPVRLEATYNEPIALRDVLGYVLQNSLPIRINRETYAANRYGFFGSLGQFLPSVGSNLGWTHSHIYPHTESTARNYQEAVNLPVFQGGRVMYGMLSQYYRMSAARNQYRASVNDQLLSAYNAYYNLLLQRALLQIRIKSVEVSTAQLRLNEQLYLAGTGTRFAVMQSRTQLALDRQALLQQQVQVRLAALNLGYTMNMPLAVNLVPAESTVTEASLLDESMSIEDLLSDTLTHRPELRQYEYLWLSSERNVQVAAAPLYPSAQWNITWSHTSTSIHSPARASTSTSSSTSSSSSSSSRSSGGSSSSSSSTSSSNIVGAGAFGGKFTTVSFGFNLNWTLSNMGTTAVANILSARAIAHQAILQANQVLLQVNQQVRSAYLNALTAREQIDVTATGVASSAEELRLANLRVQMGVGTNLELIQAQRDYITALINQAQAIIASNQAQAQLLHDTGLISLDTLTTGYRRRIGTKPNNDSM